MSGVSADALALDHQPESGTISLPRRVLAFFGIGRLTSRSRKSLVWMLWNLSWGFVQFFVTLIILFLVGLHLKSPYNPNVSEWDACDRPLGVWAALWLFRVVIASSLCYWEYRIDRHDQLRCSNGSDIENTDNSPRSAEMNNGNRTSQGQRQNGSTDPLTLPYTQLYKRLTVFSSLVTLIWFVIGNILVYTSINTCRFAAPWLWWLNFAFLLKLYLVILEAVIPTIVVLIVAPILFNFWNIFLICIGRHPSQNPDVITSEIGRLPKSIVDRIPLVIYIPPPDDLSLSEEKTLFPHVYPPKPSKRQMRFRLLQKYSFRGSTSKAGTSDKESANDENNANHWADDWEPGQYPFITLDGNKAACAICLNDFGPPPKRKVVNTAGDRGRASTPEASTSNSTNIESTIGEIPICEGEDAGLGPQPLRLLGCTHVFHPCIDPWLTDVSGRCPLCQKRVDSRKPQRP